MLLKSTLKHPLSKNKLIRVLNTLRNQTEILDNIRNPIIPKIERQCKNKGLIMFKN